MSSLWRRRTRDDWPSWSLPARIFWRSDEETDLLVLAHGSRLDGSAGPRAGPSKNRAARQITHSGQSADRFHRARRREEDFEPTVLVQRHRRRPIERPLLGLLAYRSARSHRGGG